MAHYAFLDENNIVTEVIVGRDEWEQVDGITDWEKAYGEIRNQRCLRTSYNGNIRKNYAGIGYSYDEQHDAFIAPKPYPSWSLNTQSYLWEAPTPMPTEGGPWMWVEADLNWQVIPTE